MAEGTGDGRFAGFSTGRRRRRRAAAFLLAALAAVWLPAGGALAQPLPRELLSRLHSAKAAERAQAARALGEKGAMAHTPALASLLKDGAEQVRVAAREALWEIWMRSGDADVDVLMKVGVVLMNQKRFDEAIAVFGQIVRKKPGFAEGWNKRATALYLARRYQASIADCNKALALNPHHFGALFGLGLNYVGLEDFEAAIGAFQRTLEVIPYSRGARRYIEILEKALEEKRKRI